MSIRFAENRDIPVLNKLLTQVNMVHHNIRPDIFNLGRKYTDDELAEILKDDTRPIFVHEGENGVDGYAFCVLQRHVGDNILTDIKTLYIDDLCVDEKSRGGGIGGMLYDRVLEFARENGCYNVTLNVWEGNDPARRFYDGKGMKPLKTYMEQVL